MALADPGPGRPVIRTRRGRIRHRAVYRADGAAFVKLSADLCRWLDGLPLA